MKIDKFEITEKDDKIYVYLEVPQEWTAGGIPRFRIQTKEVKEELDKRGCEYGPLLHSSEIKNWRLAHCRAEWIFEKKTLDKTPEPVIIREEKAVQPKPTRKKRTRSSTKKVSTED